MLAFYCILEQEKEILMLDNLTIEFIKKHRNEDVRKLALQAARYPSVDMSAALCQIEGWQLAQQKLPSWHNTEGLLYPPKISMEQCSSEATSGYKASLMQGTYFADLTGGFGIDCSYISPRFRHAAYIERNTTLCNIARHNFSLLGLDNIEIINSNCEEAISTLNKCDWIFIDPARRDTKGNKVAALDDCEPDITRMEEMILSKCNSAMIKCSPMLDITAACRQLKHVKEIHVVAVNNECKELLFILNNIDDNSEPIIHCINITKEGRQTFTSKLQQRNTVKYAQEIEKFLYEPNAAIQKAGCPSALSMQFNIKKLHPNSNLYTATEVVKDFPGRTFIIEKVSTFSKGDIKDFLKGMEKANITVRNFPDTVQTLRKRFKLTEGGDNYIFATTLADNRKVLIKCRKI